MRVVIAAGGTGGHIYPAIAIINKIKEKEKDSEFLYIGTTDRMEKNIIPGLGIPFVGIEMVGLNRKNLFKNFNGFDTSSINDEMTRAGLANKITDYLAQLTKEVLSRICAILITLGGETSYKCCDAIGVSQLSLVDEVLPAIALSRNVDSTQYIVTKSGNLGKETTIMDILRYFETHEG